MVPLITITLATVSSVQAAVNCASVDTVVVVPPFPPVTPPFCVAYPVVGISVMVALFMILPRSTSPSSVGVGTADTSWVRRATPVERIENFMLKV